MKLNGTGSMATAENEMFIGLQLKVETYFRTHTLTRAWKGYHLNTALIAKPKTEEDEEFPVHNIFQILRQSLIAEKDQDKDDDKIILLLVLFASY